MDAINFDLGGLGFENTEDREAAGIGDGFPGGSDSEPDDTYESSDDGGGEYLASNGFPPKDCSKWKDIPFDVEPMVTVDSARSKRWKQGKVEIRFMLKKISELGGVGDNGDARKSETTENHVRATASR